MGEAAIGLRGDVLRWRGPEAGASKERCLMAAVSANASEMTLTLSEEERGQLLRLLEQVMRDKQIEEHRTDALDFKEYVQHEEALLQSVIHKLRRP
jgi:hypothetical protein